MTALTRIIKSLKPGLGKPGLSTRRAVDTRDVLVAIKLASIAKRRVRVYSDRDVDLRLTSGMRPVERAYAHGETNAEQTTRPTSPACPFWYMQRLVEKPA